MWAAAGLFLTLAPGYVKLLLGLGNLAIGGAFVSLMLFASAGAQLFSRRLPDRIAITIGLILLPTGLASLAFANPMHSAALLVAGALVVGAAHGFGYLGAMVLVNRLAPAARRAEVASGFYIVSYLGVALPVIAVGFGAQVFGLLKGVAIFAAVVSFFALALLGASARLASLRATSTREAT